MNDRRVRLDALFQRESEVHSFFYALCKLPALKELIRAFTLNAHGPEFVRTYCGSEEYARALAEIPKGSAVLKRVLAEMKSYPVLIKDGFEIKRRYGVDPRGNPK